VGIKVMEQVYAAALGQLDRPPDYSADRITETTVLSKDVEVDKKISCN